MDERDRLGKELAEAVERYVKLLGLTPENKSALGFTPGEEFCTMRDKARELLRHLGFQKVR